MKTTIRENIEQLLKDYSLLVLKYEGRVIRAEKRRNYSEAFLYYEKKRELESVIKDLEEALK